MSTETRELIEALKLRAGLDEEQAVKAAEVFEELVRERAGAAQEEEARKSEYRGLFTGTAGLFRDRD
ncbi:MAG: hypothetical protein H0V53_14310 [Rubrobacter sp.]|nr:hypothetical protein [Rubrobacter sp.]